MSVGADRWITRTTTGCVVLLALIAATVSYLHMHALVSLHGQPGWVAALTPLSVDGMIVAASTTLLADSRSGTRGSVVPWSLLVVGSVASLTANVAVAQPTFIGRVVAAWPSFALTASYELLTRQLRRSAANAQVDGMAQCSRVLDACDREPVAGLALIRQEARVKRAGRPDSGRDLQRRAWHWALAHRATDGSLPSGKQIAGHFGRHERWGRFVKSAGLAGEFSSSTAPDDGNADVEEGCSSRRDVTGRRRDHV